MVVPLLLVVAPPLPAAAQEPWLGYPCPSGTLELQSITYEVAAPGVIRVELPGSLPCSAEGKFSFAVATFVPGDHTALVYDGMLGAYNPVGTTGFVAAIGMEKGQELGVCLMADPVTRLSCVRVSIDSLGGGMAASLDRTRAMVVAEPTGMHPQPECNVCWSIR
jgi:hypothetical protein